MIPIPDPYTDYVPPDHQRNFVEERRVTRLCIMTIAELPEDGLLVEDGVLTIPEDAPDNLRDRMARYEGYLRWAAGLPATHWLSGGPANIPEAA